MNKKKILATMITLSLGACSLYGNMVSAETTDVRSNDAEYIHTTDVSKKGQIGSQVMLGYGATATGDRSIAIGNATAEKQDSVVIGNAAKGTGQFSVTVGQNAKSGNNPFVLRGRDQSQAIKDMIASIPLSNYPEAQRTNALLTVVAEEKGKVITDPAKTTANTEYVFYYGGQRYLLATGTADTLTWFGNGGDYATAVGERATAMGQSSIAIGSNPKTTQLGGISIGGNIVNEGYLATAIGRQTKVAAGANEALALGTQSQAGQEGFRSVAIGYKAQVNDSEAVSIGSESNIAEGATQSISIGAKNVVSGKHTVALGDNINVSTNNSVVLGASSAESKVDDATTADVNGITYTGFKGVLDAGNPDVAGRYVSVGAQGEERQVKNVAAGVISAESTDAINGSQLYATNNVIGNVASGVAKVLSGDNKNITVNPQTGEVEYTGTEGLAGTKATNFEDAIKAARTTVNSSTNTIFVKGDEKDGAYTYDINVNKGTLTVGDDGKVTAGVAKETTDINPNATADNSFTTAKDVAEAINQVADNKANVDASNLTDENVTKWQDKLGNGTVTDGNAGLVTGDTVFEAIKDKADTSLTNLTEDGQNVVRDLAKDAVKPEINRLDRRVNKLDDKVNKVGAGAAALAALHPLDFDPDDKWNFAAGYGNYSGANAMAVGAYYRPNEDTMFSVAGSMGNGENMVNAGVSFKLGQKNSVSNSRVAIAKEVEDLKTTVSLLVHENKELKQAVRNLQAGNRNVTFSDLPTEHWAYNYVKTLADKGLLEGYPDGTFKGDASMTRYEFATVIYRALQNGAIVDANMQRAMNEFAPELEKVSKEDRFRVDRVAGNDNDRHKIERVRVNNESNKETNDYRDVYGSKVDIIADKLVASQPQETVNNHHVDLWSAINK